MIHTIRGVRPSVETSWGKFTYRLNKKVASQIGEPPKSPWVSICTVKLSNDLDDLEYLYFRKPPCCCLVGRTNKGETIMGKIHPKKDQCQLWTCGIDTLKRGCHMSKLTTNCIIWLFNIDIAMDNHYTMAMLNNQRVVDWDCGAKPACSTTQSRYKHETAGNEPSAKVQAGKRQEPPKKQVQAPNGMKRADPPTTDTQAPRQPRSR